VTAGAVAGLVPQVPCIATAGAGAGLVPQVDKAVVAGLVPQVVAALEFVMG